jgi:hypothetical protein
MTVAGNQRIWSRRERGQAQGLMGDMNGNEDRLL